MVSPQMIDAAQANKLSDIDKSYAKGDIEYLTSKGIIAGVGGNLFAPLEEMNRESFAALLGKTLGLKEKAQGSSYKDVSPWAQGIVGALEEKDLVAGYSKTRFGAKDSVTREQMAVFYVRAFGYEEQAKELNLPLTFKDAKDVSEWARPLVAFAEKIGFIGGYPDGTFKPQKASLRQDVAALSYRYIDPENTDATIAENGVVKENKYITKIKEVVKEPSTPVKPSPEVPGEEKEINFIDKSIKVSETEWRFELGREVALGEKLTVLKDGVKIDESKIKIEKLFLDVTLSPSDIQKDYTLSIVNENGIELFSVTKNVEDRIPAKLTTKPVGYAKQVGEKVSVSYGVIDEDGEPIPGVSVRIKVQYFDELEQKSKVIEEVVLSDEKGEVHYSYTSLDARRDTIHAIAVDRPADVRNDGNVTVDWSLAKSGLGEVDQPQDIELGAGTYRDYTVAFKDEANNPVPKGTKVFVYLGDNSSTTTKIKGEFTKVPGSEQYAEAIVKNFEGKVTLSVSDESKKTIKPSFYYDLKNDNKSYKEEANDPRVQAGATMYIKQVPTFILNDKKTGKIATGDTRTVELEVIDQFENPYLGVIKVGLEEAMDNINETKYGAIKFDLDINRDGDGADAGISEQENKTGIVNINFGARIAAGDIKNSVVDIIIKDGLDKDKATLAVFYDENENGFDAQDPQEKLQFEFEKLSIKEISLESSQDAIAEGNEAIFTVSFKDQNGKPIALDSTRQSDIAFEVLDEEGNVVSSFKSPKHQISLETDMDSYKANAATFTDGTDYGDTLSYNTQGEYEQFIVKFTSDTAGTYSLRAYLDDYVGTPVAAPDQVMQNDEVSASKKIVVEGSVLTSGTIMNSTDYSIDQNTETFTYVLRDQDRQTFDAKKDQMIQYSFTNDGKADLEVEDQIGVKTAISVGETVTVNAKINIGENSHTMQVKPISTGDASVNVSAQVKDMPTSTSLSEINWVTIDRDMRDIDGNEDVIYNGTILAFNKKMSTEGPWYVMKSSVGNVLVQYEMDDDSFAVDKNSDAKGLGFHEQLTFGDKVTWEYDGTTKKQKHDLENK